jgi:hypothetical protein
MMMMMIIIIITTTTTKCFVWPETNSLGTVACYRPSVPALGDKGDDRRWGIAGKKTGRRKLKYPEKALSHCHCFPHKPHMGCYRILRWCIQKFPDWPPGARTANGTALCH